MTSPFEFYQYWFGAADIDVGALLRKFTLLDQPTIERVEAEHVAAPERRVARTVMVGALVLVSVPRSETTRTIISVGTPVRGPAG